MATGTLSDTAQQELNMLRNEIDAVDRQLIALLKERIEIVAKVGQLKRCDGSLQCFIRSGRESDMLRDIYTSFEGSKFHPEAACAIWRQIISASTQHESAMELLTPTNLQAVAQGYFGDFMPVTPCESVEKSLTALQMNPTALVILPHWEDNQEYWQEFAQRKQESLNVFAGIPFIGEKPQAFVAANLTPEPSRDDISLFMDESGNITQADGYHTELASNENSEHKLHWLGTYGRLILKTHND